MSRRLSQFQLRRGAQGNWPATLQPGSAKAHWVEDLRFFFSNLINDQSSYVGGDVKKSGFSHEFPYEPAPRPDVFFDARSNEDSAPSEPPLHAGRSRRRRRRWQLGSSSSSSWQSRGVARSVWHKNRQYAYPVGILCTTV